MYVSYTLVTIHIGVPFLGLALVCQIIMLFPH
jgi:hypothetical protein